MLLFGPACVLPPCLLPLNIPRVQLVDEARKEEDLLWYTSTNPSTPLHPDLPLNTAVALPVSLDVFHMDLCFVFFAEHDVNVRHLDTRWAIFCYTSRTALCPAVR